jgi:hypothetical protein
MSERDAAPNTARRMTALRRARGGAGIGGFVAAAFLLIGVIRWALSDRSTRPSADEIWVPLVYLLGGIVSGALAGLLAPFASDRSRGIGIGILVVQPFIGGVMLIATVLGSYPFDGILIFTWAAISVAAGAYFGLSWLRDPEINPHIRQ